MSNAHNALAQLKDIHLPKPIDWWPPAPGWFMAALVLLGLGFALVYHGYRRYQQGQARRRALKLLQEYKALYQKEQNVQAACARVSQLLRRVALAYFPRREVASLQGRDWVQFLDKTGKRSGFARIEELLLEAPYQGNSQKNPEQLFIQARAWIKQRRAPCLN